MFEGIFVIVCKTSNKCSLYVILIYMYVFCLDNVMLNKSRRTSLSETGVSGDNHNITITGELSGTGIVLYPIHNL